MKMKKIMAAVLSGIMCMGLCSCGNVGDSGDSSGGSPTDWEYIQNKGTMVVGITSY